MNTPPTKEGIRLEVEVALESIAPDVDASAGNSAEDLFVEFDIDSMDFLHLITRLAEHFGTSMPESDYPRMRSIDALVKYLSSALGQDL